MVTASSLSFAPQASPIGLPTPSLQFIELHLPSVDPVFESLDVESYVRDACPPPYTERKLSIADAPEVLAAKDAFLKAVDDYNHSDAPKELDASTAVDLRMPRAHTWPQLISALEAAEQRYREPRHEGRRNRVRQWVRKFSELEGTINSWIRLLPSESWQGSLVCGGLKVIVTAAAQLRDLREEISTAIQQVPLSIQSAVKLSEIYTKDLEPFGKRLIIANLEAMQACVQWFAKGCFKKAFGAVIRGKDYAKNLSEKLNELQQLQKTMDREAMNALHQAQSDDRKQQGQRSAQLMMNIETMGHDMRQNTQVTKDSNTLLHNLKELFENKELLFDWDRERKMHVAETKRLLRDKQLAKDMLARERKDRILEYLEYQPATCLDDLSLCLRLGGGLLRETQIRSAYILDSPEIDEWTSEQQSSTLVVNAQEPGRPEAHSTASFFSTMLASALENTMPEAVVLHWFCGRHPLDNPLTMVSNLVGQLLDKAPLKVDPDKYILPLGDMPYSYKNLEFLLLKYLRLQLRHTPVYCILDSISMYEDNRRVRELLSLWTALDNLGRADDDRQHPLKLIATSPTKTVHIGTRWDNAGPRVLSVPSQVPQRRRSFDMPPLANGPYLSY